MLPVQNSETQATINDTELLFAKNKQMEKIFSKLHLGAFFAPQKTGLSGGSAACAADGHLRWPRPFNPLRTSTHPLRVMRNYFKTCRQK
jgi:hypothetical protein